MITVVTIKQVIVSFEGAVAPSYVVYFRSIAGIGLLHLMFARSRVPRNKSGLVDDVDGGNSLPLTPADPAGGKAFPNLLT
jgi:hypothetical protein